ncbi:phycobiliprotein lyase [Thalassoporum mexicanum]|uniref:phycobiliprotein lyase n=1 Tax=Thalassoporum mexicanum TaxID=3457544 RepID=UPI0002DFC2B3|nr:phycobiliprotein lyase [Pseudanabaena sp. PCC 7367]
MNHSIQIFNDFFIQCVGRWSSERTYHYLAANDIERSHTDFAIFPLTEASKQKVLLDNQYDLIKNPDQYPGFHLGFETVSEHGDRVTQSLNLMFVYQPQANPDSHTEILTGDYLRDRAYEEAKPMVAKFTFDPILKELKMTTTYTSVVSVDSITLINPQLRIRKIINYLRPTPGAPLKNVMLVGFGVEQKQPSS